MAYYRCPSPGCGYVTRSLQGLRMHYKKMHPGWCFVCGRKFSERGGLYFHILYFHIYNCINRNPKDREHLALYSLVTARRDVTDYWLHEQLYLRGLEALEEITEVREE